MCQLLPAVHKTALKLVAQTLKDRATKLTRHFHQTVALVTLRTTRPYQILLSAFKFTPLLKFSAPQTVWLAPNYYPHIMNIWLLFRSTHLFLRCWLLWKCESKQWQLILQHILSNPYKLFTVNIQLSFIVCCFKQSSIRERRVWQLGLCKMAERSVMWSSSVFFSLSKTGDVRVVSRSQESVSVAPHC